jgi:hypothetical protein
MLTAQAKEDFKSFIERIISYAVVTVNGTATKKAIHHKERLSDGRVAVYIEITPELGTTATITKVQLYNTANKLWAEKSESISLSSVQEGALYRFVFDFVEKEV